MAQLHKCCSFLRYSLPECRWAVLVEGPAELSNPGARDTYKMATSFEAFPSGVDAVTERPIRNQTTGTIV